MHAAPFGQNIKELPSELWIHIFALATHVPKMMDVSPDDPLRANTPMSPHGNYSHSSFLSARKSNLSLALVCKHWYNHAMPVLFGMLNAKPGFTLRTLRDTIVESQRRADASGPQVRSLGSFTRRLELRQGEGGIYYDNDDFRCLADMLRYLPNLHIIALELHRKEVQLPNFVIETLLQTSGHSLRRVYINPKSKIRLLPNQYESIIARCPQIRAVYRGGIEESMCAVDLLQASNLSFVDVTTTPCTLTHSNFGHHSCSSTQSALFNECTIASPAGIRSIQHFVAVQGRHLRAIFMDIGVTALPGGIQGALNLVEEHCPHLEHLILIIKGWDDLLAAPLRIPPVHRLGLFYDESYGSSGLGGFSDLFEWFAGCEVPSSTSAVRLLGETQVKKLRALLAAGYNPGIDRLSNRSYRLEDYEGNLFVVHDQ
ncbi:uncharacterized protein STEHIDRAFT_170912 [Stereum hirsutum FP-91666 SS1]|uniref:uncharacterized protein n=1 Tax=Stereum hirsutum (strain FP-91666) TaxID=721885 RepID=UPI00044492C9|nr:uncharacterized protein STEHIDRAFT_170912 [Stereum hirsutum FP-91666 SS1]EIM82687.1 hypothetical protein STEHIDRAFT_170912 [Stereum hirsutum FP-91666 SS1]